MTTSSSEHNRCTRISPSAVLDDRLDGKDLEWARDHLRRCEACRERVENFREMLLRVGRLPSATVGAEAMDQAYAASIPQRLRQEDGGRSYEFRPAAPVGALSELPSTIRPEVASVPDLLTELEREIFRDEPAQDHPTPFPPREHHYQFPAVASPDATDAEPAGEVSAGNETEPQIDEGPSAEVHDPEPDVVVAPPPEELPTPWRQVSVDSHQEPEAPAPVPPPIASRMLEPEPLPAAFPDLATRPAFAEGDEPDQAPGSPDQSAVTGHVPATPNKPDTVMRIAVGLGAAACVLLAALLYEGGWFAKAWQSLSASGPTASASIRPAASSSPSASSSPRPTASPPPAPVLFTLGNGVSGATVFRIRPGTAVAGYTRLVFDMHGSGLPTMVIRQPDTLHLTVTFKDAGATGIPVSGIHSYQVAGVEPAVQQDADAVIGIDLARPVRVTAFTLPATGGYAWRLVIDLHTS
jgi:hypothetical protein